MWIGTWRSVAVWRERTLAGLLAVALAVGTVSVGWAVDATTTRVSVGPDGSQASGAAPVISANGRFVAFVSRASNLSSFDTNNVDDIFVRDLVANTVERVSVPQGGGVANRPSTAPAFSADGRYVAFQSESTNLAPGSPNPQFNIYVRDRIAGTTERVSVAQGGGDANNYSLAPAISADGRFVAFESIASNLVSGDTNERFDVFVRDRVAGTTERVSLSAQGEQLDQTSSTPAISADGRYVAYESLVNLPSGVTTRQVFLRDRVLKTTQVVSLLQGQVVSGTDAAIGGNGRYVAFRSTTTFPNPGGFPDTPNVFVHDRVTGLTELISAIPIGEQGNGESRAPAISADGRFVVFESVATDLVPVATGSHANIFIRDRLRSAVQLVSVAPNGAQGNQHSAVAAINGDGRFVAFGSLATNLITGDTNNSSDVFVRDRATTDGLPQLSVLDARVREGSASKPGVLNFEVLLSRRATQDATFRFWTEDVTARDGGDYIGTFNTVTIPAGSNGAVVSIPLFGDTLFERDDVLRLNIDTPNGATILDGQGVGVIENDDQQGVGTLELTPAKATVGARDRILYTLEWTVPSGSWRDLQTIELRFGGSGEQLWVAFDEATRTLRLIDANGHPVGPSQPPGSNGALAHAGAQVHLAESRFVASGPTSPTVRLELSVSFGVQATGAAVPVQVRATADNGQVQGFDHAGVLSVRP